MNLSVALNRRSSSLHHQALVLAAMIYQVLTLVMVQIIDAELKRSEQVSVERVFALMAEHLMGIHHIEEWFDWTPDRRHVRSDQRKDRQSPADIAFQLKS